MDEPIPEQPKKRGWVKGRKRGPRKPKEPTAVYPEATSGFITFAAPEPPQAKPAPSSEPPEPVSVEAITTTGQRVSFMASRLLIQNGRYVFTSYPAQRGYKRVTVLRADQMASFTVTAPEDIAEMLTVTPAPPQPPTFLPLDRIGADAGGAMVPQDSRPIVFGPPLQRPPYSGGDPRRFVRDQNVERASTIPNPPGIPMSEISKGEEGVPETIRATMG